MWIKTKHTLGALMTAAVLCGLSGCGQTNEITQTVNEAISQENGQTVSDSVTQGGSQSTNVTVTQGGGQNANAGVSPGGSVEVSPGGSQTTVPGDADGSDLDVIRPDPADDKWYMEGNVYRNENGDSLEAFFDDYGMLGFSVNGLSLYYTTVDGFVEENDWKVYTCDDGTMIVFYPGEPAHLEISDGEYAGLYEEQ